MKERYIYLVMAVLTMALGLLSRSSLVPLPSFIAAYSGDTLWALMVYWGFRFVFPSLPVIGSAALALSFSFSIEILQLYQAPWIESIRHTRIGGLVLGYDFVFSDLLCYFVGIATGSIINSYLLSKSADFQA